jgi:hypothetical protein
MLIGLEVRNFFEAQPSIRAHGLLSVFEQMVAAHPGWRFTLLYRTNHWRTGWQGFAQRLRALLERPTVRSVAVPLDADPADSWLHVRLPMAARELGLNALFAPDSVPAWSPVPVVGEISRERWLAARAAPPGSVAGVALRLWTKALARGTSFLVEDEDIAEWIWSQPNASPGQVEITPHWFEATHAEGRIREACMPLIARAAETLTGVIARATTAPRPVVVPAVMKQSAPTGAGESTPELFAF